MIEVETKLVEEMQEALEQATGQGRVLDARGDVLQSLGCYRGYTPARGRRGEGGIDSKTALAERYGRQGVFGTQNGRVERQRQIVSAEF